jgi:uncharacterized protein (DUF362 family)
MSARGEDPQMALTPEPGHPRVPRRQVVAALASAAGLLAATACGQAAPSPTAVVPSPTAVPPTAPAAPTAQPAAPTPTPGAPAVAATTPALASPAASPAPPTAAPAARPTYATVSGTADLAIVHGASPAAITRAAVDAIGGMKRFVKSGQHVVVKPNICTAMAPEYAATTNPEVVAALVTMCKEAGAASVKVLDYPWGSMRSNYRDSGIEAAVQQAGGEMIAITPVKWKKVEIPNGKLLKSVEIFDDVLKADVLINVPIAKNHNLTKLTLGMKNLMGVVSSREQFHMAMGTYLSDLLQVPKAKPAFTLVDAVRILTDGGPGGGYLDWVKKLDTVVASTDILAVDTFSTSFFGVKPEDIETITTGARFGVGTTDLSKLKISEVTK